MMADDLVNNEAKEFFGEVRVKFGIIGQFSQTRNLALLAPGVCRRKAMLSFVTPHSLRHFEPFGEHENKRRSNIVDAVAVIVQLHISHAGLPPLHLP